MSTWYISQIHLHTSSQAQIECFQLVAKLFTICQWKQVNGSLDQWLFMGDPKSTRFLDWPTRFNIAMGTAKGLAYLHHDCQERIVHLDIKPQNILLDDAFNAKVSDFGLAKLMSRSDTSQVKILIRVCRN